MKAGKLSIFNYTKCDCTNTPKLHLNYLLIQITCPQLLFQDFNLNAESICSYEEDIQRNIEYSR